MRDESEFGGPPLRGNLAGGADYDENGVNGQRGRKDGSQAGLRGPGAAPSNFNNDLIASQKDFAGNLASSLSNSLSWPLQTNNN